MSLLAAFVTSLLLGMRHATDPDHIIAVTTIVSRERSVWKAGRVGALWGVGHTLTIFAVGGLIILLKLALSARLGLSMEFVVAVMLIVLGLLNLLNVQTRPGMLTTVRPVLIGVVHGLAGSAAATLLILPLIDDAVAAVLYLLVFGVGTIIGMAAITLSIAGPSVLIASRVASMQAGLRIASGAASLIFGLLLVHKVGIVDGLLSPHPRWTPH